MNQSAILSSSLFMTLLSLIFLSEVRGQLNAGDEYEKLADFWKSKVSKEQHLRVLSEARLIEFKQEVALVLPGAIKNNPNESEGLRALASVIPHSGKIKIDIGPTASELLKMGKQQVIEKKYDEGVATLGQLIEKHPDSLFQIEAHYLIVEAYAQKKDYKKVMDWSDRMVELYPSHRLTGYSLLKVAKIFEEEGRGRDAVRVYKTIVAVYRDSNLLARAKDSVRQLEL